MTAVKLLIPMTANPRIPCVVAGQHSSADDIIVQDLQGLNKSPFLSERSNNDYKDYSHMGIQKTAASFAMYLKSLEPTTVGVVTMDAGLRKRCRRSLHDTSSGTKSEGKRRKRRLAQKQATQTQHERNDDADFSQ